MSSPELDALRRAQDRDFASEGIPMVLGLVSEVAPIPAGVVEPDLVAALQRYSAVLGDGQRPGDPGVEISVLQALAVSELRGES
jgi:hypothetical protein